MLGSIGKKLSEVYAKGKEIIGDAFEGTGFDDPTSQYGAKRFEMRALERKQNELETTHPYAKKMEAIEQEREAYEFLYNQGKISLHEYNEGVEITFGKEEMLFGTAESDDYYRNWRRIRDKREEIHDETRGVYIGNDRYKQYGDNWAGNLNVYGQSRVNKGTFDLPLLSKLGKWLMDR
jgi:hypothetical protein